MKLNLSSLQFYLQETFWFNLVFLNPKIPNSDLLKVVPQNLKERPSSKFQLVVGELKITDNQNALSFMCSMFSIEVYDGLLYMS